jgi:hypothetical protein
MDERIADGINLANYRIFPYPITEGLPVLRPRSAAAPFPPVAQLRNELGTLVVSRRKARSIESSDPNPHSAAISSKLLVLSANKRCAVCTRNLVTNFRGVEPNSRAKVREKLRTLIASLEAS